MKRVDLRETLILAVYVAVILAVLRAVVSRVPGPIGRIGAYL